MPSWMKWTIAILIGLAIIVIGFRWAGPLLTIFFVMNCLVLIIVVLLQSGKAVTWPAPSVAQAAKLPLARAEPPRFFRKPPHGAPSCS
jgi:hypothetical protein